MIIRRRAGSDLGECVRILAEVHRADGYPEVWPADPAGWLHRPHLIAAWAGGCWAVPGRTGAAST